MKPDWIGVYPALTTNFFEDESLDLQTFSCNIEQQIQAGVHGIIVAGSLGENSTLTFDEKLLLLQTAQEIAAGRVPVVIGLAEASTRAAIRFAQASAESGADGLMLLPPMRYPADNRETLDRKSTRLNSSHVD